MQQASLGRQGSGFAPVSVVAVSFALLVSVLWFFGNAEQAYACSCAQPGSPSEELEKFSAVFAGRVVSVQHSYDPDGRSVTRDDRSTIGFEVSAVWKGTVHEQMTIRAPHRRPGGAAASPSSKGNWARLVLLAAVAPVHRLCLRQPVRRGWLFHWHLQSDGSLGACAGGHR